MRAVEPWDGSLAGLEDILFEARLRYLHDAEFHAKVEMIHRAFGVLRPGEDVFERLWLEALLAVALGEQIEKYVFPRFRGDVPFPVPPEVIESWRKET
jgi:hypothetical protein